VRLEVSIDHTYKIYSVFIIFCNAENWLFGFILIEMQVTHLKI